MRKLSGHLANLHPALKISIEKLQQVEYKSINLIHTEAVPGGDIVEGAKGQCGHRAGQTYDVVGHREVGGGQAEQQALREQGHDRVHRCVAPEQILKRSVFPAIKQKFK
jgi:hypothetical protein